MNKRTVAKFIFLCFFTVLLLFSGAVVYFLYYFDLNQFKPRVEAVVYRETGRRLVLSGDIDLVVESSPGLRVSGINFENGVGFSAPCLFKAGTVRVNFRLKALLRGRLILNDVIVKNATFHLEKDALGRFNTEFEKKETGSASEPVPSGGKTPGDGASDDNPGIFCWEKVSTITLLDCRLSYLDMAKNLSHELFFQEGHLETGASEDVQRVSLQGIYNSEDFTCSGEIGGFTTLMDAKKEWPVALHLKTAQADFKVGGAIEKPIAGGEMAFDFDCRGTDIQRTLRMIKLDAPLEDDFQISGRFLQQAPGNIMIKKLIQKTSLGASAGNLHIDVSASVPSIQGKMVFKTLFLDKLMQPSEQLSETSQKKKTTAKKPSPSQYLIPDVAIPSAFFGKYHARLELKIGELLLNKFIFRNIVLDMSLSDDALFINPLSANMEESRLHCKFVLKKADASATRCIAIIEGKNLDIQDIMNDLKFSDKISGTLDCEIKLRTQGTATREWLGNLEGKIRLVGGNGVVNYANLKYLGNDLSAGLLDILNPFKKAEEEIKVNCFVSAFDIYQGRSEMTVFLLDTSQMSLLGEGGINLNNEKLEFRFKSIPKKGIHVGAFSKMNFNLAELVDPFKLSGTLKHPKLALDFTEAGFFVGKMIGGIMLFGPAGIMAVLVNSEKMDENPCLVALEKAKKGICINHENKKGSISDLYEHQKNSMKDTFEDILNMFSF